MKTRDAAGAVWEEAEQVEFWLLGQMSEACGDPSLAVELVAAGADYRRVEKAKAGGATTVQLAAIFL